MKKKVDSRIRTLIENGVKMRHRSLFVIVGDKGRDQIVNLHYMLSKASVKPRPGVLWCYKKDLGFSSNAKKRAKSIKRDIQRGVREADQEDPFELFVSSTNIRYCYYKETHTVLGNTFGMCVLQDFEALTPNLLARTVETVEGGGIVVLLLKTMSSLKQLYTMSMDVHSRFRTEAHQDVVARFNERFILSVADCKQCLVVDDELNILPISAHVKSITPVVLPALNNADAADGDEQQYSEVFVSEQEHELNKLKADMQEAPPIGSLVQVCRTLDQAKAVLTFADAIAEKTLRSTVALTAGRGRGKSAALGLSLAAAIAYGYANIFVTAPSPENLHTLFEMVFKGFDALGYKEHTDYEAIQSTNPELNHAVVRVNVHRAHRQTIQYIAPQDYARLAQAELLVIDEAAAIPLPLVKKLLGPYLVFMSSTINGYEGTGRSLSLKLIKELRQNSVAGTNAVTAKPSASSLAGRTLREVALQEPIRYGGGDPVEKWLADLLCLDCLGDQHRIVRGTPHPSQCELYYVNRDTLFSYHKASEAFLQRMMSLYVSSHYKNTPNDLQLLSDAPAHHLFALLGPQTAESQEAGALPDILCVIQVCLEGEISKESVMASLARGERAAGDLIPWTVSQQFQDNEFPQLSGARIVRIATHPDLQRMGYASRALNLLTAYYAGEIANLSEEVTEEAPASTSAVAAGKDDDAAAATSFLLEEKIKPRKRLGPLLETLADRRPESLHWIGTSFGVTQGLFNFWKKNGYCPIYLRQTANDLTGEHTCVMLRALEGRALETVASADWLQAFADDFRRRFVSLLSISFSSFDSVLALSVLDPHPALISTNPQAYDKEGGTAVASNDVEITFPMLQQHLTGFDLKRLESYARNMVDYHMILDIVPAVARLFFLRRLTLSLSYTQAALLMALGLQHKTVTDVEREMELASNQVLALFNRAVRKLSTFMRGLEERAVAVDLKLAQPASLPKQLQLLKPSTSATAGKDVNKSALSEAEKSASAARAAEVIGQLNLQDFSIAGGDSEWNDALSRGSIPSTISIKNASKSGNAEYQKKPKREADLALLKGQLAEKQEAAARLAKQPKHRSGDTPSSGKKHRSHDQD